MDRFLYIDDYFKGATLPKEKMEFEEQLMADEEFAEDVAFYLSTVKVARDQNNTDKKKRFREIYYDDHSSLSVSPIRRLSPYITAAAAVLAALFFGLYLYMQPINSPKLAGEYIGKHLQTMSVEMSGDASLIQTGKDLYNNKNYAGALQNFEQVIKKDTANYDAVELAGIAALQLQEFDKALQYFKQLANNGELKINAGKFYEALTLMKKNLPADKEQTRVLLQEVTKDGLYGKEDAIEFLKKL